MFFIVNVDLLSQNHLLIVSDFNALFIHWKQQTAYGPGFPEKQVSLCQNNPWWLYSVETTSWDNSLRPNCLNLVISGRAEEIQHINRGRPIGSSYHMSTSFEWAWLTFPEAPSSALKKHIKGLRGQALNTDSTINLSSIKDVLHLNGTKTTARRIKKSFWGVDACIA